MAAHHMAKITQDGGSVWGKLPIMGAERRTILKTAIASANEVGFS
jgi:hypothetical protein